MACNRVKTTNRGTTSESTMRKAALLCLDTLMSVKCAATKFNICYGSLKKYIKKFKRHRRIIENNPGIEISLYDVPTPQHINNRFSRSDAFTEGRVKTTNRGTTLESTMRKAALLCLDTFMSVKCAAKKFNICHGSLKKYIKKFKRHRRIIENNPGIEISLYNVPTPKHINNEFSRSDTFTEDQFEVAVLEHINEMFIDNVDEGPINDVIRESRNTIAKEPVNIDIIPHLKTEGSSTPFFFSSDLHDSLLTPETYNLIRKIRSEINKSPMKFKGRNDKLIDNVDKEPINDVIRESRNTIAKEPANIDIIPHLKTEGSSTPSFFSSDPDDDSFLTPETYHLIRKLRFERNNPVTQKQE